MDYYSEIAEGYEELHKEEQLKKLEIIKKYLDVKSPLLDIGCGTGIGLKFFGVEGKGVDPSPGLVEKAGSDCVVGKAEKLPFDNNSFNTIISITALHHTDIDKAIEEIRRVSKKRCKYAFTILRRARNASEVVEKLVSVFNLKVVEEDEKDIILFNRT